ncbi:MAG: class I SAM-dependent methyltransferase [Candidatus Andersenbacteria bacterium]
MRRKSFDSIIKQFLLQHVPDEGTVLDVGCGTGWTALFLARQKPNCAVEGVDIDTVKIHRANALFLKAKRDHIVRCYTCSAELLAKRLGYGRYDVVISNHSLHHYPKPVIALRQIRATLKPNGYLLLSELDPSYGEEIDNCPRYSLKKIIALLKQARFHVRHAQHKKPGVLLLLAERTAKASLH